MSRELWALLYLHDWDDPKPGQVHPWVPWGNVFPEIAAVYDTWQAAEKARATKINPHKYSVRRCRLEPENESR
jgi:hypothetical protein